MPALPAWSRGLCCTPPGVYGPHRAPALAASFRPPPLLLSRRFSVSVRPDAVANAAAFSVESPRYLMEIAPSCSGMEGFGLILAFTSIWLWYSRKECRFPHVLLLIPCGLGLIWILNVVRLCALFLIGDAGNPEVADVGFHSRFGWIAFTAVALAFSMTTQRLSWVRKGAFPRALRAGRGARRKFGDRHGCPKKLSQQQGESPAIRAYLIPFLAILAAAFSPSWLRLTLTGSTHCGSLPRPLPSGISGRS